MVKRKGEKPTTAKKRKTVAVMVPEAELRKLHISRNPEKAATALLAAVTDAKRLNAEVDDLKVKVADLEDGNKKKQQRIDELARDLENKSLAFEAEKTGREADHQKAVDALETEQKARADDAKKAAGLLQSEQEERAKDLREALKQLKELKDSYENSVRQLQEALQTEKDGRANDAEAAQQVFERKTRFADALVVANSTLSTMCVELLDRIATLKKRVQLDVVRIKYLGGHRATLAKGYPVLLGGKRADDAGVSIDGTRLVEVFDSTEGGTNLPLGWITASEDEPVDTAEIPVMPVEPVPAEEEATEAAEEEHAAESGAAVTVECPCPEKGTGIDPTFGTQPPSPEPDVTDEALLDVDGRAGDIPEKPNVTPAPQTEVATGTPPDAAAPTT